MYFGQTIKGHPKFNSYFILDIRADFIIPDCLLWMDKIYL